MMSKHVMIVEDSPTQALKLQLAIEEQGFKASCFESAEGALEALNTLRPDLIIVDYHLPGIPGDDLCRRVRMNINTQDIPILMLTMDEDQDSQLRGLESGADDYVSKSEDTEILMLRVHSLLRKSGRQASIIKTEDAFFRKARLLIIDDSPTYLEFLSGELGEEGYFLDTALNAEEGLALAEDNEYDCVLVDLVMPDIDGLEVCKSLGKTRDHSDSAIIILLISAHESKENAMQALEAGADDFVGKSGDVSVLKARIRALLRHKFLHEQTRKLIKEFKKREDDLERMVEERTRELKQEVADRKQAENEAREARDQAEEANQAKTHFLANMSHELRTPLNAIIGYTDMIIHQVLGPLGSPGTEKYEGYIGNVNESGQLLLGIINDILDLSSIEVGKAKLNEEKMAVDDVINAAWRLVKQPSEKGLLDIVMKIDNKLPLLYADERLFKQTLLNLFSNAVKFTPEGGRITVKAGVEKSGSIVITVTDTGIGIASTDIKKVLSPFGQVDGELSRKYHGTGLGLPLSKTFMELHGGTLDIKSKKGSGTTVSLRFPSERVIGAKDKS